MKAIMWVLLPLVVISLGGPAIMPSMTATAVSPSFPVELQGVVDAMPSEGLIGLWRVSGISVRVDPLTRFEGNPDALRQGSWVKVAGWPDGNGGIMAERIQPIRIKLFPELEGVLTGLSDEEVLVAGISFQRSGQTLVWGQPQPWERVEVIFKEQHDGSRVALVVRPKGQRVRTGQVGTPTPMVTYPAQGYYTKFYGTVEAMPSAGFIGTWTIGGRAVNVTGNTRVEMKHGMPAVGAYVEVKGFVRPDGVVEAEKIEVKKGQWGRMVPTPVAGQWVKFYGQVEALPAGSLYGLWRVGGYRVQVSQATRLEEDHGPFEVGAWVEVKGYVQPDGSVVAVKVETER